MRPGSKRPERTFGWEFAFAVTIVTVIVELACIVFRFGFGLSSSTATASTIGVLTLGYRIHHGYVGLLMAMLGNLWAKERFDLGWLILAVGTGLVLSDLIHHFAVLWPLTGSPQFDLRYPDI
ncbi:MAG: hypothetical protein AAFU85_22910 [Planctomycetota bacterium]